MTNKQNTGIRKSESTARRQVLLKASGPKSDNKPSPRTPKQNPSKSRYVATLVQKIHHLVSDFPLAIGPKRLSSVGQTSNASPKGTLKIAQLWAAVYFLPLLDCRNESKSPPHETIKLDELCEDEPMHIRIVTRPTEALRLPGHFLQLQKVRPAIVADDTAEPTPTPDF